MIALVIRARATTREVRTVSIDNSMNTDNNVVEDVLEGLNPQQRQAASHTGSPLLIIAGAGTGKTTTLARRVAYLIATGVDPSRILLLTFTRRASTEMLRRVDGILQQISDQPAIRQALHRKTWGGTFHAISTRLLRRYGEAIGLKPEFTIFDRSDAEDLLNVLRVDLELHESDSRFPLKSTCLDIYSRCANTQDRLERVLKRDFPWCEEHQEPLKKLFRAYVDRKEDLGVLDYDDLLLFWDALLDDAECRQQLQAQFDCVLVDEYQDTNTLQASILKKLVPDGTGLTVVGDDAQSIYSFRAATVRNILDFPQEFPGTKLIPLEENYRSTQPILDATNCMIGHAKQRHEKNLWSARKEGDKPHFVSCRDEDEQTDYVIRQILEHREQGTELKNQAVLFRASHHSLSLEVELGRRNIPFHKYGGLKFIETGHVKDFIAFLRLAENPFDLISGTRVLMLMPGIGHKKSRQMMDSLANANGNVESWESVKAPKATSKYWPAFVKLMVQLSQSDGKNVTSELHAVRQYYGELLELKYDHVRSRLRDLEQLEQIASRFNDRSTFLTELMLDPPSSTQELPADPLLDEDYLILSTIHSAKGLEWDSVYVLHAADGNIPSDMATGSAEEIEEERRLFYVALTRARNHLFVCCPERYYTHHRIQNDNYGFAQKSRFLSEDVLEFFQSSHAAIHGDGTHGPGGVPNTDLTTADIRSRIKQSW